MISERLFDNGQRSWHFFGRDPERSDLVIDTNEYLVVDDGVGALLDPGGTEIFPQVIAALSRSIGMDKIEVLFGSHQDPDIISSLSLWVRLCPDARVYAPQIWGSFLRHFAFEATFEFIPDAGMQMPLGSSCDLELVPAHYLHSSGNFSVYDPQAKILWTGDIGAAVLPAGHEDVWVTDFDAHVPLMEGFHRRWMPSNAARDRWIERVRKLDVEMICPQHGSLFRGENVGRFLDWFARLELAGALAA